MHAHICILTYMYTHMYTHDEQIFDVFFSAILLGQISANKILFSDKKTALQKLLKKKISFLMSPTFFSRKGKREGSGLCCASD